MKGFKSYSLNKKTDRQTDMTENITYPLMRVVKIGSKLLQLTLCVTFQSTHINKIDEEELDRIWLHTPG